MNWDFGIQVIDFLGKIVPTPSLPNHHSTKTLVNSMGRGQERAAPRVPRADPGGDGQMVELPWQELVEWKQHRTLTFLLSLVYT